MDAREDAQKYFERGLDLYESDRFNDAIAEFTEAIRLFPNGDGIYNMRGSAYGQQGKFSEAIADFEMALKLNPGTAKYIDNIAMTKLRRDSNDVKMAFKYEPARQNYGELPRSSLKPPNSPYLEKPELFEFGNKIWFGVSGILLLSAIGLLMGEVEPVFIKFLFPLAPIGIITWRVLRFFKLSKQDEERMSAYYKAKRSYEEALSLQKVAEQGQVEAQFKLGLLYFNGEGVPKDFVRAAEWFRKAAGQGHTEANGYIAKTEAAEKEAAERKAREEKERIQDELRGAKKYLTFITVSVLVGLSAGLVFLALSFVSFLDAKEALLIAAIISPLIGFYIPGFWPVLKHTWLIERKIPSVVIGFLGGDDEGFLVNVITGFIFLFTYPFIAMFGAPINIIVTIVKYFSLRKEIKRLSR